MRRRLSPCIAAGRSAVSRRIEIPSGLGWDSANYPIELSLVEGYGLGARSYGSIGRTPASLFDRISPALSAPTNRYYVNVSTGSDTNPGTAGFKFKSIWKAIQAANLSGQPACIFVDAGVFPRSNNPWFGSVLPLVDIALIAVGGLVDTGTFDNFTGAVQDATYANCYSFTLANAERVVNRLDLDYWGDEREFLNVATAAIANVTPNSWSVESNKMYINRADRAPVTNTNTRVFRQASSTLSLTTQRNLYIGGIDGQSGWALSGGNSRGVLDIFVAAPSATRGIVVVENARISQAGGIASTDARAISFDSFNGLLLLSNVRGSAAQTDVVNGHDTYGAPMAPAILTLNTWGVNTGRTGQTSCNGWTIHEGVKGIDLAGLYADAHGGVIRNIHQSRALLAGTVVQRDLGERALGAGTFGPVAISAGDTAQIWCDSVRVDAPPGTWAYHAAAGATVARRNCWPVAQPDAGAGAFVRY